MKNTVLYGNVEDKLREIPDESVQTVVCSPPYWQVRDYDHPDQLGLEETPEAYYTRLGLIFQQVKRTLKPDGTVWLNLGDCYAREANKGAPGQGGGKTAYIYERGGGRATTQVDLKACGLKPKDLVGIPWRTALHLQKLGWYLRADIVWEKPNAQPEPVKDRPTKSHEMVFLLSKSEDYYYDYEAIQVPSLDGAPRNRRSVWNIKVKPFHGAHFAVMPPELARLCILAGSRKGDLVLDPFAGSGTTLAVAADLQRDYLGIELNPNYKPLIDARLDSAEESRHSKELFDLLQSEEVGF